MRLPAICLLLMSLFIQATSKHYFPDGSLDRRGDNFKTDWYSRQLIALEEPSLSEMAKISTAESYRFIWLRSFHHPIVVRLEPKQDGTSLLTVKIGSGAGGYPPGKLSESYTRMLTVQQTQRFLALLTQTDFWRLPNPVDDNPGEDGSQWLIEGVKGGKYHVVDRWSPKKGPVRELGMMLAFELAGIKVPTQEIY
jgi:hypothetical protein